ncbi:hypothetical protein [Aliiroseovarius sp.]|uniref:hypothetical protein n=1 Tax=Aliiroseovarius sp. TaxID=1872442 RepID=UPI003BA874B7
MELVLHIGAHRTATTAMQDMLVAHRAALLAAGVTTLVREDLGTVEGFSTVPARDGWIRSRAAMDRLTDGAETVLLSEENLIGDMGWNIRSAKFYGSARRRLQAYREFLGMPRRVGLSIRDYASYWISAHGHELSYRHVGKQGVVRFAEARARLAAAERGWLDLIRDMRAVFKDSEILVWPVEHRIPLPEVTRRLLVRPGLDLTAPPKGVNAAPDPGCFAQMEAFRATNPKATRAQMRAFVDGCAPEPFDGFDADQTAALQARYAADLAALKAGFEGVTLLPKVKEAA